MGVSAVAATVAVRADVGSGDVLAALPCIGVGARDHDDVAIVGLGHVDALGWQSPG